MHTIRTLPLFASYNPVTIMEAPLLSAAATAADALIEAHRASHRSGQDDGSDRPYGTGEFLKTFLTRVVVLYLEGIGVNESCAVDITFGEKIAQQPQQQQ